MTQNFLAQLLSLTDTLHTVNPSFHDTLDIAVIAIVFFFILKFLIETRSTTFLFSVLGLSLLYGLSLLLDLPLSHQVVASLFGTFLIIIAIISQRELRRFFTFYGAFQLPHRLRPLSESTIAEISAAIFVLVKKKTGALFVFPGIEPIERYLEGGFSLRGDISMPLILSIFDTSSPGHDGALVIENDKIRRFGVHLPLAEGDLKKVKNFGLRHRAALGLADRSDALVVVVSEEKGMVHVAQDGKLASVESDDALRALLAKFYAKNFPEFHYLGLIRWAFWNGAYLVIASVAALILWAVVNSGFTVVQRNFVVTPEFKGVNAQFVVASVRPDGVEVDLRGRSYSFESLKPEDIRVTVDLSGENTPGKYRVGIAPEDVKVPISFSVINISPENVQVQLINDQRTLKK